MFEYRRGESRAAVSALFGPGFQLVDRAHVEDPGTGTLLLATGGMGREVEGGSYLLRWGGRPIGLEYRVVRREDEHGTHPLFVLSALGTSVWARMHTGVAPVVLTGADAACALRVAAEACVVYESCREDHGPGARVADPDGSGRELSPADFGYPEITRVPWDAR